MKTRYIIVPIMILAMLALAAFSTPAIAACFGDIETRDCDVTTSGFLNGTITNGSVMALENKTGLPDIGNWTITLPPGEVVVAYAHWYRWGECPNHSSTAEFWNDDDYYQNISIPDSLCPAGNNETRGVWYSEAAPDNGTHHYYWRVNATPGDNVFNVTGCYKTPGQHCDNRWFVAVINNTDENNRTHTGVWWHNFGYERITQNPYTTWFYNASIGPVSEHNYSLWTAQSHYDSSDINISVNNNYVGTIYGIGGYPTSLEYFNVPKSFIETDGSQNATWDMGPPDDYFYGYFATLAEKLPSPDLVVDDIIFPYVMKACNTYTIRAKVHNQGDLSTGNTFNVSLWINGSFHSKKTGFGPLLPCNTTLVNFTNVHLGECCHNFTVIADCDDDVNEGPYENNNERTEWYAVGHNVTVVHNNSHLMTHPDFINRGGTYYLENRTIWNCVGCGVTIKNTTLPFVIQNCTVHDCNNETRNAEYDQYKAGICLYNVTNGQIGNHSNTIVNNTNAGIRVQNSTYVDIINNYISNNTEYGIYVYPDQLVKPPYPEYCKYINVTNNTVTKNAEGVSLTQAFNCTVKDNNVSNNTKYGVYICGNYSTVYNNTIENNTDYGIKMYNASGNCVYMNNFIDNNQSTPPQAWDNRNNRWNTTKDRYYYSSSANTNNTGNNWSDYVGGDANGDGIGDIPYNINGGIAKDYYPLMYTRESYSSNKCGDVDGSGFVTGYDAYLINIGTILCNWAADADCSGFVTGYDAYLVNTGSLNCCNNCCE